MFRTQALQHSFNGEYFPGEALHSDAELATFVRMKANHVYHPVGSCKMGADALAVVDERLRVHGLQNLRVVDASVMLFDCISCFSRIADWCVVEEVIMLCMLQQSMLTSIRFF
jgi:choline dehydrogenase-like flavoprotein